MLHFFLYRSQCELKRQNLIFVLSNLVLFDFFECVFIVCDGGGGSWLNAMHRMESTKQIQTKQRKTVDNFQCFFLWILWLLFVAVVVVFHLRPVTCIRIIAITITSSTWLYYFGASTIDVFVCVCVCIAIFLTGTVAWWRSPHKPNPNRWS